ncbi:MAG TPA: hypothetical protein PLI95_17590, partial [Polyangiaceae bacterium]|nr:hypothetical protein [Polyangiaceae bacterium]
MTSNGVLAWTREVCVCQRKDLSRELVASASAVLPEDRLIGMPFPKTIAALHASPLIAVSNSVGEVLAKNGVRVHTLGIDHVSGGIYYFAEGGDSPPKRVQGDLYAAIRHSLVGDLDSSELDRFLDGIMDRMLALFSDGALSEHAVELAALLPPICEASEELEDLDTIEASLSAADDGDDHAAAKVLETSIVDPSRPAESVRFSSPWGTVDLEVQDALVLELMDGDEGKAKFFVLPKRERWLLSPQTETPVPTEAPAASLEAERVASEKAAAEKAAAEKAAAEKAAAEKAAAEKAAAEKAAAEKAAAEKAAAERAAAAKAAAEKAAAERAAAEKAAAEKAAAEKAAAEKAAAEKAAAEKAAAEKAAAE